MENLLKLHETMLSMIEKTTTKEDIDKVCDIVMNLTSDELKTLPNEIIIAINRLKKLHNTPKEDKIKKEKASNNINKNNDDVNISIIKMDKDKIKDKVSRGIEYGLIMFTNYNQLIAGKDLIIINEDNTGGMIVGKHNEYNIVVLANNNPTLKFDIIKVEKIKDLELEIWSISISKNNKKNKFVL